ncbi:MAG TPA: type II secretion system F family protein [Isosphaeraceae bacterium]|jgi:type II secretory pathway component PulF
MSRDAGDPLPPRRPRPPRISAAGGGSGLPTGATPARKVPKEPPPALGGPSWGERVLFGSVGAGHLATFCGQFASYLDAGVDLLRTLASLEKQFARTALGPVLGRLQLAVRRGEALADAMAAEAQAFDPLFLSMMRVAEARGGIPETLRRMARHYETRARLIRQARSAMIYPVIVLSLAAAVVALLTLFVLPGLISMLEIRGGAASLPLPTRLLMGFSAFMQRMGWWLIPVVVVGKVGGLIWAYRTRPGKAALDEASLYIPVLGLLLRKIDTTRFARTLSALLGSGVDYGESLDLTADVLHLVPFRRAVRGSRTLVLEGTELSRALEETHRFGPDVIAVIETGEETGMLPEALGRLADSYEEQVASMVKNLGQLIQPLLMIGLGGIVLFIVVAFVMAYASMLTNLGRP